MKAKKTILKNVSKTQTKTKKTQEPVVYKAIKNFNPKTNKEEFIIVQMDHSLLDDMLRKLTEKGAQEIGVPCRRVK
jgi:carbamoylphosphate synthase small subunit